MIVHILKCASCGQLNRISPEPGKQGIWRCGKCRSPLSPNRPRPRYGLGHVVLLLGLLGGTVFWAASAAISFDEWGKLTPAVEQAMLDSDFVRADSALSRVERESAKPFWSRIPVFDAKLTAVQRQAATQRSELTQARALDAALTTWGAQLATSNIDLQSGDLAKAARSLVPVEAKLAAETASVRLPKLADRLSAIRRQAAEQRKELEQARPLVAALDQLEKDLAASAAVLRGGNLAAAEQSLGVVETALAAQPTAFRLPGLTDRLNALRKRADENRKQLQDAQEAVAYTAKIERLLAAVRAHLEKRNGDAARDAIKQAQPAGTSTDPVLDSLTAFVGRQLKTGEPRGAELLKLTERMVRDAVAWRKARLAHRTAEYLAFLKESPDSPFADEAKARIIDVEVADIRRGNPGPLPRAEQVSSTRGRNYSILNVHNDTSYELTLRYSGPDSFKVVFAPHEKGSLEVLVGKYSVAASVNASSVRNYAGEETSYGGNQQITFYIRQGNIPYIPPLALPGFPGSGGSTISTFEAWPNKRALPAYLK